MNDLEVGPAASLNLLLRHIAQRRLVFRNFDVNIESGLEVRLVEARESSAGVARLKLCAEHVVEFIVLCQGGGDLALGLVLGAVEAGHDLASRQQRFQTTEYPGSAHCLWFPRI